MLKSLNHLRSLPHEQMVVFGDSTSDSGRRLNAPESFDFEGIGAFPWRKLYATNDAEVSLTEVTRSGGSDSVIRTVRSHL